MEKQQTGWETWNQLAAEWDEMYNSVCDADKDAGGAVWMFIQGRSPFAATANRARWESSRAETEPVRNWLQRVAAEADHLATIYHLAD